MAEDFQPVQLSRPALLGSEIVLFRRIFAAVLLLFILLLGSAAYLISSQQTAEIERQLIDKLQALANATASKLQSAYIDRKWPLQDLHSLAADRDFLFWWVVDPNRRIHLADTAAVMGMPVDREMDDAPREITDAHLTLNRRSGYGVLILPLDTGPRRWSFWVGFSLGRVARLKQRIEWISALGAAATLTLLGILLYLIVKHFLKPVHVLTASAEAVGRGDLSHRTNVRTPDELGLLAASFNRMVEKLERTTVSRAYVDGILSSMADSVIVLDSEWRIRTVNRSACELLGAEEADLISRPLSAIFECAQECEMAAVLTGSAIANREACLSTSGGSRIPVLFSAALMQQGHHEVRLVMTLRDVTELNLMKNELARARDTALASTRHKSEFLANMSHEIRTPMNGIIGMSELLAGTTLTAEQRDYLEAVHYSAESLLGIINDVLDVSKIEAGKVKIDPAPFDLREWFDDLLRPLAFRAHRQGLDFAGTLRGEVVSTVVADADRLRQVLINLIGNAIKFTKQGEIEVAIEVVMDVGDSHSGTARLCFSVRDSGIGIPAEKQNLIFESFTQADGSISRRYGGSGLGLTISSQFVRLMGGELEVKSSTGGGSTFRFAVRVPVTRSVAGRVLASKKVLVADRPGVSRHALENLLAELGAETTTAGSDAEALAMAGCAESGRGFDMVLIDSRVASAGLANLARSLQENGAFQGKVVLMETLVDRQSPGFDPDVPGWSRRIKPLRRADLAEIVGGGRESDALAKSRHDADGVPLPAGLHALVVEDNTVNQRVITGLLKKKGYRVTVAPSGEDAIACATRGRFDLILMDIQMPGMSGIETTALLRSREAGSGGHCPIVALTANAMKGDREKYIAAGMDDYLSKPIRSDELYRVLSRFTACASPEQARNAVADEPQPQPMN